jgi:osmoprotectant transport system substrate-binding protein
MDRRVFLLASLAMALGGCARKGHWTTVGSKNFTEQLILGELLAQTLEAHGGTAVDRRFYLAGTYICQQALLAGRIDVYVEYTGTALAAILKEDAKSRDHQTVFEHVRDEYRRRFSLEVFPPLGFDNTFAMVIRSDDAQRYGLKTLSDFARISPQMRVGCGYEFVERNDGLHGLMSTYGLSFREPPRVMDLGLIYRALQNHQVDVVAGSNTDGLIAALKLTVLEDDRHYFPPYDAVPIVRHEALARNSEMRSALDRLTGQIDAEQMRRMNYAADAEKQDAAVIAMKLLVAKGIVSARV